MGSNNRSRYEYIPFFLVAVSAFFLVLCLIHRRGTQQTSSGSINTTSRTSGTTTPPSTNTNINTSTSTSTSSASTSNIDARDVSPNVQFSNDKAIRVLPMLNRSLSGNPYSDTQVLLSPGTIVAFRDKNGQWLSLEEKTDNVIQSPANHWVIEHSPYYCREGKAVIRLKNRQSKKYLGWKNNQYQFVQDQGQSSSFFAVPSILISNRGDASTIALFDVQSTEKVKFVEESSPYLLQVKNDLIKKKSSSSWQWTIVPIDCLTDLTNNNLSPSIDSTQPIEKPIETSDTYYRPAETPMFLKYRNDPRFHQMNKMFR